MIETLPQYRERLALAAVRRRAPAMRAEYWRDKLSQSDTIMIASCGKLWQTMGNATE